MFHLTLFAVLLGVVVATKVNNCKTGELPENVRIKGCDAQPCTVIKGTTAEIEIDFIPEADTGALSAKVRATALGITVPYPLPEEISNVCKNLLNGQQCPVDAGEFSTYKFMFPIGNYPEIGVTVEVTLVDQDKNPVSCFKVDVQVQKKNF